jgi:hypothetical protein
VTPANEGSSLADESPQPSVELTAGAGSHGCLPGDYGFGKNAAATLLARLGAFVCELLGASNCQTVKGLPATDDGEYQYEIRSVVEGHKSGRDRKRVDALTADGVSAIVVRRSRRQPFRPAPPRQQAAPRIEPY